MRLNKDRNRKRVQAAKAKGTPLKRSPIPATTSSKHNWPRTHEGAPAYPEVSAEQMLARSVLSCMLWEDTFYEGGQSIADRIYDTAQHCRLDYVSELAVAARTEYKLRHAPLMLLLAMVKTGSGKGIVSDTIYQTINRPDEMAELLSLYWKDGRKPLANQLKKGLARAFTKFDNYQLRKYAGEGKTITLRDIMFLAHPGKGKADDEARKQLADQSFTGTQQTWESKLSAGEGKTSKAEKKRTWTGQIESGKLGYMALLKNLRNMNEAGVAKTKIEKAIRARKGAHNVLPFRFLSALKHAPAYRDALNDAFIAQVADIEADDSTTAVLVDVSGSMTWHHTQGSEITTMDRAATLAMMVPGKRKVFAFADRIVEVKDAKGLDGIDRIVRAPNTGGGTRIGSAVQHVNGKFDRIIVITDEQSHDHVPAPTGHGYMINVASYQNGVGYGDWVHIDGFSEATLKWIAAYETAMDSADT